LSVIRLPSASTKLALLCPEPLKSASRSAKTLLGARKLLNTSTKRGTKNRQTNIWRLRKAGVRLTLHRAEAFPTMPPARDALAQGRRPTGPRPEYLKRRKNRAQPRCQNWLAHFLTLYTGMGLTTTQQPTQRPPGPTASAVSLSKLTKTMRNKSLDETMNDLDGTVAACTCEASTSQLFADVLAKGLSQLLHLSSGSNST